MVKFNFKGSKTIWAMALLAGLAINVHAGIISVYVSAKGSDNNKGTRQSPFKTIERARDQLRQTDGQGVRFIWLKKGKYHIENTIEFTEQDSSEAASPLFIKGFPREKVQLIGGKSFKFNQVKKVSDKAVLAKIPSKLQAKAKYIDLKDCEKEAVKIAAEKSADFSSFSLGNKPLKGVGEVAKLVKESYCIDADAMKLYFVPGIHFHGFMDIQLGLTKEPLIKVSGAAHMKLENLIVESSQGDGIVLSEAKNCKLNKCTIRNVGNVGVNMAVDGEPAADVDKATLAKKEKVSSKESDSGNEVVECTIYNVGKEKVRLNP